MRLIDADKLQPDRFSDKTGFSVSCDQIAEAKVIDAVPKDLIEFAKEIQKHCKNTHCLNCDFATVDEESLKNHTVCRLNKEFPADWDLPEKNGGRK